MRSAIGVVFPIVNETMQSRRTSSAAASTGSHESYGIGHLHHSGPYATQ